MTFDNLFATNKPIMKKRGVHLDLKGVPPTASRLMELLKLFAAARYNVVLVEWEDTFPWTVDERFRSPTAYSPADIRQFQNVAKDLGLEIIPLVQCLGHMETPLGLPEYRHLQAWADDSSELNPLADGARALIQAMVDDVLALMPEVRHFHLGGDEAWSLGRAPATEAYAREHGKAALYLKHVEPLLDHLNARNIRPILWHDMMVEWESGTLKALAGKSDLMTWGYSGHPDTMTGHCQTRYIKRFQEHGLVLWGGTAYKGGKIQNSDLPDIEARQLNALAWADIAQRFQYAGVIATAWSRFTTNRVQCDPIDSALDSLVNVGVILHDGKLPAGGIEACVAALASVGEQQRFEACKAAMTQLAAIRQRGWLAIQMLREQIALCRRDTRRTGSHMERKDLRQLKETLRQAETVAQEVRRCFDGLMEPMWIEEYLDTRLAPLREELAYLEREEAGLDSATKKKAIPRKLKK